jgi:hypothetical protein
MTSQEIEAIALCLRKRVVPRDAEEGAILYGLAQKLVAHFSVPAPVALPAEVKSNGAVHAS